MSPCIAFKYWLLYCLSNIFNTRMSIKTLFSSIFYLFFFSMFLLEKSPIGFFFPIGQKSNWIISQFDGKRPPGLLFFVTVKILSVLRPYSIFFPTKQLCYMHYSKYPGGFFFSFFYWKKVPLNICPIGQSRNIIRLDLI